MSEPDSGYHFFVPGEIVLVVEHTADLEPATIPEQVFNSYPMLQLPGALGPESMRVVTFEPSVQSLASEYPCFSFVFAKVGEAFAGRDLLNLVVEYNQIQSLGSEPEKLRLAAVTPNWLLCGMPYEPPGPADMGGGGGPGTKPVQAAVDPKYYKADLLTPDAPWNFHLDTSHLPKTLAELKKLRPDLCPTDAEGQAALKKITEASQKLVQALENRSQKTAEVAVVILDTLPPFNKPQNGASLSLSEALQKWQNSHPLLKSLMQADVLCPEYETQYDEQDDDPHDPTKFNLSRSKAKGHPHFAMDHGTFVAGIVHTLAPQAQLRLVEVLNARAYGSFEIIAKGFKKALDFAKANPGVTTLVNMSLAFSFPWVLDDLVKEDESLLNAVSEVAEFFGKMAQDGDFSDKMTSGLKKLCELMWADDLGVGLPGGLVIAAAGNDGKPGKPQPPARFPAAFEKVIGVAALDHTGKFAPYSSKADAPTREGIAVFGGAVDAAQPGWADPDHGMLGLYIGDFPDPKHASEETAMLPNQHGWARWSGTSFAAPVVTGCLALLISQGMSASEALETIRWSFIENSAGDAHLLSIAQG